MYILVATVLAAIGWFIWKRLQKRNAMLGKAYWFNSALVALGYLIFLVVGGFATRLMVGFNNNALADLLLVGFYLCWIAYGGLWVVRLLPTTRKRPRWAAPGQRWLDGLGVAALIGFAVAARLV